MLLGYIHVYNNKKNVENHSLKGKNWNLQQWATMTEGICWHQNSDPSRSYILPREYTHV